MKTIDQIAKVLYDIDPMGTCCKENDLHDEYISEAKMIHDGHSVKKTFFYFFWSDCLNNREIEKIEEALRAII